MNLKRILAVSISALIVYTNVFAAEDADKIAVPEPAENAGVADMPEVEEETYDFAFDSIENAKDFLNVQNYITDDNEKGLMYGAENIMRRDGASGETWAVFEIPHITELYAVSYHLASDVAPFKFELSVDMEEWEKADVSTEITTDDDKWTMLEYKAEFDGASRYVRVLWGTESNTVNWWNPYFGGLFANAGESLPAEIVIGGGDSLFIPMYDSKTYTLTAKILDDIGIELDGEVIWSVMQNDSYEAKLTEDGELTIPESAEDGAKLTVRAELTDIGLYAEKEFALCAAMPGDSDGDNVITMSDINEICRCYGMTATKENRLCDTDKNGVIDIIDLAYAARYMITE